MGRDEINFVSKSCYGGRDTCETQRTAVESYTAAAAVRRSAKR